jgi:hypothetical protein
MTTAGGHGRALSSERGKPDRGEPTDGVGQPPRGTQRWAERLEVSMTRGMITVLRSSDHGWFLDGKQHLALA